MLPDSRCLTVEVPADGSCPPPKDAKVPRKVLHFSDGIIEEYSTDEEDRVDTKSEENVQQLSNVDPKSLEWVPWFWYQTVVAGTKTLEVCDYLGESLASFFGITTPKYQFEIDHFNEMVAEEEALKREQDLEMGGWVSKPEEGAVEGRENMDPAFLANSCMVALFGLAAWVIKLFYDCGRVGKM